MRTECLLTIAILFLLCGTPCAAQQELSLDGIWKFRTAKTEREKDRLEDFYKEGFNSSSFHEIPVPSNWAVLGFEEPVYKGSYEQLSTEGFYLKRFTLPYEFIDKRVFLDFGGVWQSCDVWLNGQFVDRHEGGFTSFSIDVTDKLHGGDNLLAVRVRQNGRGYMFDIHDDWSLGGIFRSVRLDAVPKDLWIENVTFTTDFDSNFEDADLDIRILVSDMRIKPGTDIYKPNGGSPYTLCATLSDTRGKTVCSRTVTVDSHSYTGRQTLIAMHIAKPDQWTAETPCLYTLRIDLNDGQGITQTLCDKVGFREISTDGGILRINGQPVKLRGVNLHDEWPETGRATTQDQWMKDLRLMKDANINFIRLCHYQHPRGFIELCDSLGFYLGAEVGIGGGDGYFHSPSMTDLALKCAYETVSRDINNPSIIYWSVGNEDPLTQMHLAAIRLIRGMDPQRPVLIPWRFEDDLPEEIGLLSAHYWSPALYDRVAARARRPMISTEYTHAYGTNGFGGLKERWEALTSHPAGAGAAIWTWADQGLLTPRKRPDGTDNAINAGSPYLRMDSQGWDGIVGPSREITADYLETKAVYAFVQVPVEKISYLPGQTSACIPVKNCYDFTDLSETEAEWRIFREGRLLDHGTARPEGPAHTISEIQLPLGSLHETAGDGVCYAHLSFYDRRDGRLITVCSVELNPADTEPATVHGSGLEGHVSVLQSGDTVSVFAGTAEYVFDRSTGLPLSAVMDGREVASDLRPTIWRAPDANEITAMKDLPENPADLDSYTASVRSWQMEEGEDTIRIETSVDFQIDGNNSFSADFTYIAADSGILDIRYEIRPQTEATDLPRVGMSLRCGDGISELHWIGKGPYDAYPNRRSAAIFGLWGGRLDESATFGNKEVQRIDLKGKDTGFTIKSSGYMEHSPEDPSVLHILCGVYPRPEKGRPADESVPQTHSDSKFHGELTIGKLTEE